MLTIGYIGNGKSTNRYHLPFSLNRDHLNVKTIYARNLDKTEWDRIPDVNYTDDVSTVMNDEEIQLVVVCTHTESHYSYAKMALDHGKHVLVEKPFMLTQAEAISIFQYAKEKNLVIQCYQNRRYDSDFLTTKKVIESGKLGDLLEIEMHYDYYRQNPEQHLSFFQISQLSIRTWGAYHRPGVILLWQAGYDPFRCASTAW